MLVRKSEIIDILSEVRLSSTNEFMTGQGEVCAVGAIVKALLPPGASLAEIQGASEANAPRALAPRAMPYVHSGDYFSALSIHFENVMFHYDDVYSEEVREELLGFVHKNFPNEVSIAI